MNNNPIQFWLSFNNGAERLRLPVNPSSIKVTTEYGFEDVDIAQFGEFTVIGKDKMPSISFASFFPRDYNSSYCEYEDIPDPWASIALLRKWQTSGRPMRLTITGTPINKAVTLRSVEVEAEKGGEPGDIYFTLSFKEYFFINFRTVSSLTSGGSTTVTAANKGSRPDTVSKVSSYTVKSGDSLWKIAARPDVYNKGDSWRKIYDANKSVIGANPNLIYPGQKLVIPK